MARENDVVLIYYEDKPAIFARIEDIRPDIKRDWYHVKLLMLRVPLQSVTWILRDIYIDGETFTMNGNRIRLEKVICPDEPDTNDVPENDERKPPVPKQGEKVISLADLKKKGSTSR